MRTQTIIPSLYHYNITTAKWKVVRRRLCLDYLAWHYHGWTKDGIQLYLELVPDRDTIKYSPSRLYIRTIQAKKARIFFREIDEVIHCSYGIDGKVGLIRTTCNMKCRLCVVGEQSTRKVVATWTGALNLLLLLR